MGKGIDSTQIWGNGEGASEMFVPADSTLIKGISIRGNGAYNGFFHYVETYPSIVFQHVSLGYFKNAHVWIEFANSISFENCVFEATVGQQVIIEATARKDLSVEHCTFRVPSGFHQILLFSGYNATLTFRDNVVSGAWEMVLGEGGGSYAFWDISQNLVFGSSFADGLIVSGADSINIVGNSFFTTFDHFAFPTEIVAVDGRDMKYCRILNNIFVGYRPRVRLTGPIGDPSAIKVMYNCLFSLEPFSDDEYINITDGTVGPDSVAFNIFRDPMFFNPENGDLHLQKGSPAIDAGTPWLTDLDGSRADIGVFGGPLGEFYAYQDLPPLQPRDFVISDSLDAISWAQNTESDISRYILFRSPDASMALDSGNVLCYVDAGGRLLGRNSPLGFSDVLSDHFEVHSYSLGGRNWIAIRDFAALNREDFWYALVAVDRSGLVSAPAVIERLDYLSAGISPASDHGADRLGSGNYPNPFNAETAIVYRLPDVGAQPARVRLTVYNTLGQKVADLVDEHQEAGEHRVIWSGRDTSGRELATGCYFYRLEVSGVDFVSKGKMLVLR